MYKIKYKGIAGNDGKISLDLGHKEAYAEAIRKLKGKRIEVTISAEERPNTRSEQKFFRWGIARLAEHIGYHEQEMFEEIQAKFFLYERDNGTQYIRSTALGEWTTTEWEKKREEIWQWALEFHGYRIPMPDEISD